MHGAAVSRRLPPLNSLRAFEAAARHLSFTLAAEELHVTQGAVSRAVKGLEDHLGDTQERVTQFMALQGSRLQDFRAGSYIWPHD
jgi:predicted transcriptional regulator